MPPLIDIHVFGPKEACRGPVKGSAPPNLRNTEQCTAHSEGQHPRLLSETANELAPSNLSLSNVSASVSWLPVLGPGPTSPQPAKRSESSGHGLSNSGSGLNQHPTTPYSAPRRDSILKSSDDYADDDDSPRSFRKLQSSGCDSTAIDSHPSTIAWLNAPPHGSPSSSITSIDSHRAGVPSLNEDTRAGAEATQWESGEVCFVLRTYSWIYLTEVPLACPNRPRSLLLARVMGSYSRLHVVTRPSSLTKPYCLTETQCHKYLRRR
jgi:hypothetical protein